MMTSSRHVIRRTAARRGAGLVALALFLAACGSDGEGTEASEDGTSTTAEAAPSTVPAASTDSGDGADGTQADDAAPDQATSELSLLSTEQILAGLGIEVSDELLACLAERGVGEEFDVSEGLGEAGAAVMGCAPEEMGALMADQVEVAGVEPDQVQCVMVELARAAGDLSPEDARAAFGPEVSAVPEPLRAAVTASAPSACGVSGEQVEAVLNAE